jgi:NADH-quinone oxidoreductase subunit N
MSDVLKIGLCLIALFVFVYAKDDLIKKDQFKGEYYLLSLFAILGMLIMISANSFLTLYLGLETLALSLYALVAFDRNSKQGSEAAMKYFVLGALASGMLLYGISMIYGATGSLIFQEVMTHINLESRESLTGQNMILVFGLVFIMIGIAFKFGAVPFHMWVPDVYQGAPLSTVLLIGSIPKIAAFGLAMRLLVDGLMPLQQDWQGMLIILAVLSMASGNVIAIAQTNIKRMLAYSTISHVGFIFLGLLAATNHGYSAAMFYAITYALTATAAFGILILMSKKGSEIENIDDLRGLSDRHPWFAAIMLVTLFSMAGVPMTVGFWAKLFVLSAVIEIDLVWLAVIAVFFSIIGVFYYLRIIKIMYFDKPLNTTPLNSCLDSQIALSFNGVLILFLGIFPNLLYYYCLNAFGG